MVINKKFKSILPYVKLLSLSVILIFSLNGCSKEPSDDNSANTTARKNKGSIYDDNDRGLATNNIVQQDNDDGHGDHHDDK